MSFTPEYLFTKGICYAEFFDPSTDALLAYSEYVSDFSVSGSVNTGEISGGPGNMLVMCVPDSARITITARTADSALRSMALAAGGELTEGGVVETTRWIPAEDGALPLTGAVAPKGGFNGPVCYILSSNGSDRETVRAASATAHAVEDDEVQDFTPLANTSYLVKYFKSLSTAGTLRVPALFEPRVVRAHFAVNCYAKKTGQDVMLSSLYKILILLLAFIWGNSMASKGSSQELSLWVGKYVAPFLELFVGKGNVTDHLVRKLAHFTEFAALGFDLLHVFRVFGKKGFRAGAGAFGGGVAAACIDEFIQLFNAGRGPQVSDVLLDSSGVLFGLLIAGGIFLLIDRKRETDQGSEAGV